MGQEIETWKPVVGWEGYYEVSSLGRIKRLPLKITCLSKQGNPCLKKWKGGFLSPHINKDGHFYIGLCKNGERKILKVHRIVAEAFLVPVPGKTHIDHIDANKLNNTPSNLRWCTHAENIRYGWETGCYNNVGSKHPLSKLTEEIVKQIKIEIANGGRNYIIAKQFGISQQNVCDIRKGRLWTHV
jgi:hypothetical protein